MTKPITPPTFGARLRQLREAKGWSQSELARRAGIAQSQINYFESGARGLTLLTARKVADALGVDVGELC